MLFGLILVGCADSPSPDHTPTATAPAPTSIDHSSTPMPTTFDALFTEHVIASFDRQLQLGDLHPDGNVQFDKHRGELTFDGTPPYRMQIIGTEDHVAGTWLWAWANPASNFPAETLQSVEQLRAFGEQHGIHEFTQPRASLDDLDGHTICLAAAGFCNAPAYYRCPYENGAVFVLITDDSLPVSNSDDLIRATVVIPQAISAVEINDQRAAIDAYFRQCGIPFEHRDGNIIVPGSDPSDPVLTAEFDENDWLTSLEGRIEPTNEQ